MFMKFKLFKEILDLNPKEVETLIDEDREE